MDRHFDADLVRRDFVPGAPEMLSRHIRRNPVQVLLHRRGYSRLHTS